MTDAKVALRHWVDRTFIWPRLPADPDLPARVAAVLANAIAPLPALGKKLIVEHADRLPQVLQQPFFHAGVRLGFLRSDPPKVRTLGSNYFNLELYSRAYADAVEHGASTIKSTDDREFEVRSYCQFGDPTFGVYPLLVSAGEAILDGDWRVQLLLQDRQRLLNTMTRMRAALELSELQAREMASAFVDMNFEERIEIVDRLQRSSPSPFFARVLQQFESGIATIETLFPRQVDNFPRFLGFSDGSQSLEEAAAELLSRMPLATALSRYAGLPCPLPTVLVAQFHKLPRSEQRKLLHALLRAPGSSVSAMHVLRLADDMSPAAVRKRFANLAVKRLCSSYAQGDFDTLLALIRRMSAALWRMPVAQSWQARVRTALSWALSHELLRITRGLGVYEQHLRDELQINPTLESELLLGLREGLLDAAHPYNVGMSQLLATGLYYAIKTFPKGTLTKNTREAIWRAICGDKNGVWKPSIFNTVDRSPNDLPSFLNTSPDLALPTLVGSVKFAKSGPFLANELLSDAIDKALVGDAGVWSYLSVRLSAHVPQGATIRTQLENLCRSDITARLLPIDRAAWRLATRVLAHIAWSVGDEDVVELRKQSLVADVRTLVENSTATAIEESDVAALIEASQRLASSKLTNEERLATFSGMLDEITMLGATAAQVCSGLVERFRRRLPSRLMIRDLSRSALRARLLK